MGVEAWYFLHGSTDGVCNLTFFLSLLSKNDCHRSAEFKRGLKYSVQPGQVDSSMLVLAKEWNIGRKAVFRLLRDFSGTWAYQYRFQSHDIHFGYGVREVMDDSRKTCRKSDISPDSQGLRRVRIFLLTDKNLETLRRSSPRKKTAKPMDGTDNLMPIKPTVSILL